MPLNVRNCFRHEVDGGWAWIVCAASFVIQFVVFGIIQSYGIIFIALLDEFKSGEYETAWIGSLAYGMQFLIAPITTTLCEHFGCRKMVFFGTGISMLALFASSFSPNISMLYFTFGILWGIGASFTYFPCILVLRFYFSERISLANGISMSGAGIGTIVINVVLNRVIQDYGWRVGLRMLGGIVTFMFVCGSVYLPPPPDFYAIREWTNYKKVKFTAKLSRILDVRPWKQKAFVVYVLGISLVLFGYVVPYVLLVRYGETLGVPSSQGALLVGYMSISNIIAKLCCGRLADMKIIKRLIIMELSILGFAICNLAVTAAKGYNGLLAYALCIGFFDGFFVVVLPILICDIVGKDLMATAIGGFYGVVATPMMLGPPISGQLYDAFNSYDAAFFVASSLMIFGASMMYVVYRLKPELIKTELQFPTELEIDAEDMFTSNLFACPSIHSHTVDALSGMFMSERYSMANLDRPSQITFNPLYNLSYGTKSRAASSASRQTYFPSFATLTDDRSEGRSEILLQRLRGFSTATETGSPRLNELNERNDVTRAQNIDDGFSTSTPKELSLDNLFIREKSEAALVETTSFPQNIGTPDVKNEVETTGQDVDTGEQSCVDKITPLEDNASTATLVNLDDQSESQTNNKDIEESEISFLELDNRTNINQTKESNDLQTIVLQSGANQLQVQDPCANGVDKVPVRLGVSNVEGLQHSLPAIPEGIEADPVNLQNEELYNEESLLTDLSTTTETPSTNLETPTDVDPMVETATLVEIDDANLDDSDTIIPEDTDVSSETVKNEGFEPEFGQNVAENYEDDVLIKLPPPPNVIRKNQEKSPSPLVDLEEDKEDLQELDDQNILVNILEEVNEIGREVENIQSTNYAGDRNKISVRPHPAAVQGEIFAQGNTEELMSANFSEAQDFSTPVTTEVVNSTHFDLLSRRLEAVAAEQMKGEFISRFPTDEMTFFAASRSMAQTPFENQGTPVYQNITCSSQQSKNPSAQRTPGDTICSAAFDLQPDGTSCMRATGPIPIDAPIQDLITSNSTETCQQPSHIPPLPERPPEPLLSPICRPEVTDYQESTKGLESNQENDIIKIPPPPDFERRRPSIFDIQEAATIQVQSQDSLESDAVNNCFEMEDRPRGFFDLENSKDDTYQAPGSVQSPFRSSKVDKEEDMTNNVSSLVPREDMVSPVFVESYTDETGADQIESAQEFYTPASNIDKDSIRLHLLSERVEDVANKQLQGESTMRLLKDDMTLFAPSRSMNPNPFDSQGTPTTESEALTSIQPVTTASIITDETSNVCSTNPFEMTAQNGHWPSSPSSNAALQSEVISGNPENQLLSSDVVNAGSNLVTQHQHGQNVQKTFEDANISMPANSLLDNERPSMPSNPFISPVQVLACIKNDKTDLLPAQGHPEKSHPISVPLRPERKRSSRKSLTIEDGLECSLSGSSNSMVHVFEIELDEDLKDRGSVTGNLAPTTNQVAQFENFNVGSSTNPFIVEMQERFPLDESFQTKDCQKFQRPTVNKIAPLADGDSSSQFDTRDHFDQDQDDTHFAIHDIAPRELPAEKELDEITSIKKIKSISNLENKDQNKDVCGEEGYKETASNYSWSAANCNESQECFSTATNKEDDYKGSQFEFLDKEIANQLVSLIKENIDSYPEDELVSGCIDGKES